MGELNKKIVLIWPSFSFYHVARFRALFNRAKDNLLGIELFGGKGFDATGLWRDLDRDGLPIVTLFPGADLKDVNRTDVTLGVIKRLRDFQADCVFVNGYSTSECRTIIKWAKVNNKRCFIFFESKRDDFKRFILVEWLKKRIIRYLDGAICGGKAHKEYLLDLGMQEGRIFQGYDVVDVNFFDENSRITQEAEDALRLRYGFPKRYFLCVSRFVMKKNLCRLVDAYAIYRKKVTSDPWGLVLCGAGPEELRIIKRIKDLDVRGIRIVKAESKKELALYYGLATCFILPSIIEQWGLVINEAMACRLPVLATKVSGAANELLENGKNGFLFNPLNIEEMSNVMVRLHSLSPDEIKNMGNESAKKISSYTPELFADNIMKAVSLYG